MSDDRLGPPPVEPISNAAWSRIERGLWEQLDAPAPRALPAPRARWPWLAVPALAAAAILALVFGLRGPASAPTDGEPSRVVAGETPSTVTYADAHLTLEARAAIVMQREAETPSVRVERGAVSFAVAPRAHGPFVVRAGDVVVRVVGTRFRVARFEERVTVAVEHGLVDVQYRGSVHRLSTGQTWSSEPEVTAVVAPAPMPANTGEPAPAPVEPALVDDAAPPAADVEPAPEATDLERAKFEELSALERRRPEAALRGYLALSQGNTKWSAVGLFAAGRLAAERNDKRARTFLTIYLRRFPTGANAEDARNLLSRLDGATP